MIRTALAAIAWSTVATATAAQSPTCLTAARRLTESLVQEAKGTRHEKQISDSIARKGGMDRAVVELANSFDENRCAFLFAAPDSTIRGLAISSLPERTGK